VEDRAAEVRLWKADGTPGPRFPGVGWVSWAPDSLRLALQRSPDLAVQVRATDGTAGPTSRPDKAWPPFTGFGAWSPTAPLLALRPPGALLLWDVAPNGRAREVERYRSDEHAVRPTWSPDGRWLATASRRRVLLYPQGAGPARVLRGHTDFIHCVSWGRDGRWFFSGGADRTVRLWRPEGAPGPVLTGFSETVTGLSCDRAGRLAVACADGTLAVWDVADSPRLLWRGLVLRGKPIAFSSAGRSLFGDPETLDAALVCVEELEDGALHLVRPSVFRRLTGNG
jgi:WD40 repeat protein